MRGSASLSNWNTRPSRLCLTSAGFADSRFRSSPLTKFPRASGGLHGSSPSLPADSRVLHTHPGQRAEGGYYGDGTVFSLAVGLGPLGN